MFRIVKWHTIQLCSLYLHRGIFKYRTRKMVREVFEERVDVSAKQLQALNMWSLEPPQTKEDLTTEPEDVDFDSDWSI